MSTGSTRRIEGPLSGYLVVDLSRALAGPHAGMMLADLGARVIKVESPGTGDRPGGRRSSAPRTIPRPPTSCRATATRNPSHWI